MEIQTNKKECMLINSQVEKEMNTYKNHIKKNSK